MLDTTHKLIGTTAMNARHVVTLAALGALATLVPLPASGQIQASLYGRGGLISPSEYFYEVFKKFVDEEPTEWTTTSLGRTGVFGIGGELNWGDDAIRVRGELMTTVGGWMRMSHSVLIPRTLTRPPFIVTDWYDIPYTMTLTSVQVILPTRLEIWRIEPYFAAGGGGKFYSFGEPSDPVDEDAVLPQAGFTWGADLAFGLSLSLSESIAVDLQARDAISKYWDKTQNDFLFTGALFWQVW